MSILTLPDSEFPNETLTLDFRYQFYLNKKFCSATAPEINETSMTQDWASKESAAPETVQTENPDDAAASGTAAEESAEGTPAGTEETEAPTVQMTLDEYRAQQAKRKAELVEALKSTKAEDASRKVSQIAFFTTILPCLISFTWLTLLFTLKKRDVPKFGKSPGSFSKIKKTQLGFILGLGVFGFLIINLLSIIPLFFKVLCILQVLS